MNRIAIMCLIGLILAFGCDNRTHANMQIAIADTMKNEPYVADFNRFYPDAENFISYYTGDYGDPSWNSTVTIDGKYVLTMQYGLTVGKTGKTTRRDTDPHFYLNIIEWTRPRPDGGSETQFSGGVDFGPDQWEKLVRANGDISVVLPQE